MNRSLFRRFAAAIATVAFAAACSDAPTAPAGPSLDDAKPAPLTLSIGGLFGGPRLLECPDWTPQSTLGLIGPLGGVLSLGGNLVDMPAGAVPEPTLFSLTEPASRYMKVDVSAVNVEHYVFGTPISVTIDYSRCADWRVDGRTLSVWWVTPVLNLPLQNMGGVDDRANRRITFTTDHLSTYVIAY